MMISFLFFQLTLVGAVDESSGNVVAATTNPVILVEQKEKRTIGRSERKYSSFVHDVALSPQTSHILPMNNHTQSPSPADSKANMTGNQINNLQTGECLLYFAFRVDLM
eukprot:scaffold20212_cov54-Attheya_sp.AAC.3